jgi:benzoate/toluate 1,2-dioxygenase beta subunit
VSAEPVLEQLEQYLFREARLIDEKRWDEWAALFADEAEYWVPATRGQPDPHTHVSLIYERSLLRDIRLRRYRHPNAMSLQPQPWSVHLISNVMLDSFDRDAGICIVNSRFIMLEYRRDDLRTHGGATTHTLDVSGDSWKITMKKVELVNCDGVLDNIQTYF